MKKFAERKISLRLRMSKEVHADIKKEAKRRKCSLNSEIICRLVANPNIELAHLLETAAEAGARRALVLSHTQQLGVLGNIGWDATGSNQSQVASLSTVRLVPTCGGK